MRVLQIKINYLRIYKQQKQENLTTNNFMEKSNNSQKKFKLK